MRLDNLYLWYLGGPTHRYVGALKLVAAGKGVSLHYAGGWLANGFALSEVVAKIEAGDALTALEAKIIDGGGSPLGGAKPKALIEIDGEQWVIKFFNNEYVDAPLIEHATLTLAAQAGICVAQTQVIHLVAANAVAIRRFDRVNGKRIHSISAGTAIRAATAAGTEPEMGYPQLARILRRIGVTQGDANLLDAQELFRRMVFNILIDNTDDHEKNHSLLVVNPSANGRLRLAPAYDVLPTNSGQGFQEFNCGAHGQESTLANAMSQCDAFGLQPAQAAAQVIQVIEVVNTWRAHFESMGVSKSDLDCLSERINSEELLSQRQTFDASLYQEAPRKRRPPSPFSRP